MWSFRKEIRFSPFPLYDENSDSVLASSLNHKQIAKEKNCRTEESRKKEKEKGRFAKRHEISFALI